MPLVFSEKEKKELEAHLYDKDMKLSYFQYKQLHYLYCIHESLVNIAGNLQQIIDTETIRKSLPK